MADCSVNSKNDLCLNHTNQYKQHYTLFYLTTGTCYLEIVCSLLFWKRKIIQWEVMTCGALFRGSKLYRMCISKPVT
jgi:hypothetical protein